VWSVVGRSGVPMLTLAASESVSPPAVIIPVVVSLASFFMKASSTAKVFVDNVILVPATKAVLEIEIAAGAGFIIPITGNIMRMPGLPSHPASENIDIDKDGNITGLF
jgi:formyltetrahydrofolate synthetase